MSQCTFLQLSTLLRGGRTANCSFKTPYIGQVCLPELTAPQGTCQSQDMLNVSVTNQESLEEYLLLLLSIGLPFFNPSPNCTAAFRSFSCLNLFGVCDDNLTEFATREACVNVRDGVCARVWQEVSDFVGPGGLPVCEDLPEGPDPRVCTGRMSGIAS